MAGSTYAIRISSQKGGVGKTTISVNLACALSQLGYETLLYDADYSDPTVSLHLGLEDVNSGSYELVTGKVKDIQKAIVKYGPTGLSVIPAAMHRVVSMPTGPQIRRMTDRLLKLKYDFIIVDTPPATLYRETSGFYSKSLIITTPELSATISAVRMASLYGSYGMPHDLVINRYAGKRFELSVREIEETYGRRAQVALPEDVTVPESIAAHIPAYIFRRNSPFSRSIGDLAGFFEGDSPVQRRSPASRGGAGKLSILFGGAGK